MPVRSQASMDTTEFKAYARRRKVKKETFAEKTPIQLEDSGGLKREHGSTDDEFGNKLLSLELDVAEALVDFSRRAHCSPQQHELLRWTCKRKRTSAFLSKDSLVLSMPLKEEPEDALSSVKKNRSTCCTIGRDSSTSDRDDIESMHCSKEYSSLLESRAPSPSSPLPSLQLPCGTFMGCGSSDIKSAFQRVLPLAPCLLTVKTEMEDMHPGHLAIGPQQVSVRPKAKPCKSMGSKAAIKAEFGGRRGAAYPEELGVKSEVHELAGPFALDKSKSPLSEKEKEARKLRRIQANRESARQTIRKKQVLCEDLTKKASSLASENEGMKQKRDALMQELFTLKGQNHHLKQQLERSSGSLGHKLVESPANMALDFASVPALPYPGVPPPPAFVWAMVAASAAASAANQAYTFNKQEPWDATSSLQHRNPAFVLPTCKQTSVSGASQQSMNRAYSGETSPSLPESPHKERDLSIGACVRSFASEAQCNDSSHKAAHLATEVASGDPSGKAPGDFLMQAGCSPLPPCIAGGQMTQGAACGFAYGGSVAGYLKRNQQAQAMKERSYHVAMVAAEARRRRKELTRNKFARSRAMRPAAVV